MRVRTSAAREEVERALPVPRRSGVTRFLGYAKKDGDLLAALWRLVFAAGLRRGELCGLRWKDDDLVGGYVSIVQTRVHSRKVNVSSPKTRAALRQVSIDPETVTALALLENAHDDAYAFSRMAPKMAPTYRSPTTSDGLCGLVALVYWATRGRS